MNRDSLAVFRFNRFRHLLNRVNVEWSFTESGDRLTGVCLVAVVVAPLNLRVYAGAHARLRVKAAEVLVILVCDPVVAR